MKLGPRGSERKIKGGCQPLRFPGGVLIFEI